MQLDWTTFLLESINFLVLVWLLKRFLYQPVLGIIEQRRSKIEATLTEAKSINDEATALRAQYEDRLAVWNTERERAARALADELDADRAKRKAELESELAHEREKSAAAVALRETDARLRLEAEATAQAAAFAARLLRAVASETLEARLIDLLLAELDDLPAERMASLRARVSEPAEITVASAYAMSESRRELIREALAARVGDSATFRFERDESLLAGLDIRIGAWSLGLNLRDELDAFVHLGHGN